MVRNQKVTQCYHVYAMCHGDTYISKPQQKKIFCYKKIFRYKKIFASPIICYNQYRSLSISQKSVINIDKDGCQLRRRSAMGRRSSSYCQES